jgi:hypothetical protein
VRYRTLRSAFHVLRVRPQAEIVSRDPGRRWVFACMQLLADLGLVLNGVDEDGQAVACASEGGLEAWQILHDAKAKRRRRRAEDEPRAYAQPNFEVLLPEECAPSVHRRVGAIARLKSLDRFWTYELTPKSVARGVQEGLDRGTVVRTLHELVRGDLPANVREAATNWAETAWWVEGDGKGVHLRAEDGLLERLTGMAGVEERFERVDHCLKPVIPRSDAARWLEERGIRVLDEDSDPPGELGRDPHAVYAGMIEAWQRRLEHGGEGTPAGSYWDDVVPVEPFLEGQDDEEEHD